MARRPIEVEVRGLKTPRERIWTAVLELEPGFTILMVQDKCRPMVPYTAVEDYVRALALAGYLKRTGVGKPARGALASPIEYSRTAKCNGVTAAPHINKRGESLGTPAMGVQAMWQAMKVLRTFDYHQVATAATMAPALIVKSQTAQAYVNALARTGYLDLVKPSQPGRAAVHRIARNTGPIAPAITRRKCVFDRNTGTFAELQTVQEVCDGLPE